MTADTLPIAFVDRDGVINAYPGHFKYVTCVEEFRMLPRAAAGIRALNLCGFKVFVVSNQAGVGKGLYTRKTLDEITAVMLSALSASGARVDGVYYCTHRREDACRCRKPATGLLESALGFLSGQGMAGNLSRSYFIGDSMTDIETGQAAGIRTILVFSGREGPGNAPGWEFKPDFTAKDLAEAAEIACRENNSRSDQ